MQFSVPLVIGAGLFGAVGGQAQELGDGSQLWLQNAGFIWVPFIAAVAVAAWFGMNDLSSAKASFKEQSVIFKRKHNWLMCWLYLATFGSFIGFAAGFPMLIKTQFAGVDPLQFAFLGPLVGALVRPLGGWLADKLGGAQVTLWTFVLMIAAVFGVLAFIPEAGTAGNFYGFLAMFMLLFVTTGIGNGSTFRMIPVIFRTLHERSSAGQSDALKAQAIKSAGKEAAAVLGFSSAVAAYGAFFIPKSFGTSMALTGGPQMALYVFIGFYISCIGVTWWWYSRKGAEIPC
jgi:NNP family nitrate/nitrite transporter-like MFS transporter